MDSLIILSATIHCSKGRDSGHLSQIMSQIIVLNNILLVIYAWVVKYIHVYSCHWIA